MIQPPPLSVLVSPILLGSSVGPSRRFSEAWRSLRSHSCPCTPHTLFCISENLQHPQSWLGSDPQVVLFFNVLYITQEKNRLFSFRTAYTYSAPCHVFHIARLFGCFPWDPIPTRSLEPPSSPIPPSSPSPCPCRGLLLGLVLYLATQTMQSFIACYFIQAS